MGAVLSENPFLFEADGPRHPAFRPRDAASLILFRREGAVIRVLMGERASSHAFLPGHFVFPGGRMEAGDMRLSLSTDLRPEVRAKVAVGSSPAKARGLALGAIRETFEETGVLVGQKGLAVPRTRSQAWRRFFAHNMIPRLEVLDFVARAITPPGRPRRFDARFFMADAAHIGLALDPGAVGGELLKPVWLTLAEARAAKILPITRVILAEVEARLGTEPDPLRPVPFYIPQRGKAVIVSL